MKQGTRASAVLVPHDDIKFSDIAFVSGLFAGAQGHSLPSTIDFMNRASVAWVEASAAAGGV
eukprot:scaffold296737_cov16-Prasinocladus_malaysianus.AAC.1